MSFDIDLGQIVVGSTKRLRPTITKDNGQIWTGIDSVTIIFEKPDRATTFERSMTVENDSLGIWYYNLVTTDIDEVGYWTLSFKVVDGPVVDYYPREVGFLAVEAP